MREEETYGVALLTSLADDRPEGPDTLDIHGAIHEARRRRTVRRAGAATAVAAAVLVAALSAPMLFSPRAQESPGITPTPSPTWQDPLYRPHRPVTYAYPTKCVVEKLPVGAEQKTSVGYGVDPTGRIAAGSRIWDVATGTIREPQRTGWIDANSHGVLVGGYQPVAGRGFLGLVYVDGQVHERPGMQIASINEKGQMAGEVNGRPARWESPLAEPTMLSVPPNGKSYPAIAIDEDGTVVGTVHIGDIAGAVTSIPKAYLWGPDGVRHELPQPRLDGKPLNVISVRSISNGWVVGAARQQTGPELPVRWDLATGEAKVFTELGEVFDVTPAGWVVGSIGRVLVMTDGSRTVQLPELQPGQKDGKPMGRDVSDDGTVVVGSAVEKHTDGMARRHAVLWRCA